MNKLGGFTMVREGNLLDYCWRECVFSMLKYCDVVTVCVATGADDTEEQAREWAKGDERVKVCIYPWDHPVGDVDFFVKWIQYARQHTEADYVLELDADEVLFPESKEGLQEIRSWSDPFSVWCQRLNFWKDPKHLIPPGVCCGHRAVRIGPQNIWMPSDGPHPKGAELIGMAREPNSPIVIGHYGFLRERAAFFRKARALNSYFFNSYDARLVRAESMPGNWMDNAQVGWEKRLVPWGGNHPGEMRCWLIERGFDP